MAASTGIGIRRHFTNTAVDPYDTVEWERRDARIPNFKDGGDAFFQADVEFPTDLVAQRDEHRRPEVLPRHARVARTGVVSAPGDRPCRRHDRRLGHPRRVLRRRRRSACLPRRAQVRARAPARRVQLAGVVQHRREGRPAAGERVLHPRGRRHHGRDPQLVPGRGHHLQGRLRFGHQPVEHPQLEGAPQGRRHRIRSGELHARRRRVGGHDQVGRQDPTRGQDGHPQRRSPRHRRVRVVQGDRGAQGACPRRGRLRHGPRRQGQPLDPVPEREQLGARHRRVHAGRRRRPRLGPEGRQERRDGAHGQGARPDAPDLGVVVGVRRPRDAVRLDDQPLAHRVEHRSHQRLQPLQ